MKNNILTEKELSSLFQNENFLLQPDSEIATRLKNTFYLKRRNIVVYQNSLSGFLSWIFSIRQIPAKAAIVSLLMVFTLFNLPENTLNNQTSAIDSLKYIQSFKADTTKLFPISADTCQF